MAIDYYVEPVIDNSDPRDKATSNDVTFSTQLQRVTIPRGNVEVAIPVTIKGDNVWESDEIFQIRIMNAPGVMLADPTGLVTIVDDDVDNLVDNVLGALDPGDRAIVWFDFQDDNNVFDTTADDAPPVIVSTAMTHSLDLEADGRTGLPGQNGPGHGASSTQWSGTDGYFEFAVTFDHNEPLDILFDHLQFWDRTVRGGNYNQRSTGQQAWEVFTSLDGFQTPLVRQQSIVIDQQFFSQNNLPEGTALDDLFGWRRQRFAFDGAIQPGYVPELPLEVTVRLVGLQPATTVIDNVELSGRVTDPCESDLEIQCAGRIIDDTIRFLDSVLGRVDITVIGPGTLGAFLSPPSTDIDPNPIQDLISVEVIGADPALTTVIVEAERPGDLPAGASLPLGTIRSDNGLHRLDLSGIPSVLVTIRSAGPLEELAVAGLSGGSRIEIGGTPQQVTSISASGPIGSHDDGGVDLTSTGSVEVAAPSWLGGNWDVASVTTARFVDGDFSSAVAILGGFGEFTVAGGNFASPTFSSGVGGGTGDGNGDLIQAMASAAGVGGSILVGQMSLDGNLATLEAVGGRVSTNLTAQRIGTIRATRSARPGDAGNIEGMMQVNSMNLVQSIGGNITVTLITSDDAHRNLRVEAFADPDYSPTGRIDSRHSFHVAGGVEAIRAHDILLRLEAGDRVDLVELLGEGGILEGDLTARSFGLVRGTASTTDVDLRTFSSEQPPPAGSMVWNIVSGGSSSLLSFEITDLERQAGLEFSVDENGQPRSVNLNRLTPARLEENVSGGSLGTVAVPSSWQGEPLTIGFSDVRFELRNSQLALKSGSYLPAKAQGGELVEVSAQSVDGHNIWLETFVITVDENPFPWHHRSLPLDVSGDGFISPIDALQIINYLNSGASTVLPDVRPAAEHGTVKWYDVAADGFVSPIDALRVINHLNRQRDGEGEAALPQPRDGSEFEATDPRQTAARQRPQQAHSLRMPFQHGSTNAAVSAKRRGPEVLDDTAILPTLATPFFEIPVGHAPPERWTRDDAFERWRLDDHSSLDAIMEDIVEDVATQRA